MSKAFSHNERPPKSPTDLSHIRLAGEADEMQIFSLFSPDACGGFATFFWTGPVSAMIGSRPSAAGIVGVIGEPHDLKAALFAVIEPVWYSDDFVLTEYFNYVRPDARRSTYATDLLAYGKRCAEDLGIDFFCGVYSTVRTEAKCRLYRRVMGEFYRYRPQGEVTARTPLARVAPPTKSRRSKPVAAFWLAAATPRRQTSSPPPQVLANYQGLVNRATGVANTPYTPYPGEQVAPLSNQTQQGLGAVNQYASAAQPYLQQAGQMVNTGAGMTRMV